MNLKIVTEQVWDKAEDFNYQCGAIKRQQNRNIIVIIKFVIYTATLKGLSINS